MFPNNSFENIPKNDDININELLEKEKQYNKNDSWNKIDKTMKMKILKEYADKYGKENSLSPKNIKALKTFLMDSLDKNKLNKTKEVIYDKEKHEITSIPILIFNTVTRNFTLKHLDKRVSTLKSLTPKRATVKNVVEKVEFKLNDEDPLTDIEKIER